LELTKIETLPKVSITNALMSGDSIPAFDLDGPSSLDNGTKSFFAVSAERFGRKLFS